LLAGIRSRLTFANVVSVIALFIALGGGAYAVSTAQKNSVVSKSIKDGQVKQRDLASPEAMHDAGLPELVDLDTCLDAPPDQWMVYNPDVQGVGYYRDRDGFVHLTGVAMACGSAPQTIFTLPPGYLPAHWERFAVTNGPTTVATVDVKQDGRVGAVSDNTEELALAAISFRCGPSGQDGCP
jgi:hypothetical protein